MKKIIAFILAVACVASLFACGGDADKDPIELVTEMYANSDPTKTVVDTVQKGLQTLTSKSVLVKGQVDGKVATVYDTSYQKMAEVADDANDTITTETENKVYVEGMGIRIRKNGSKTNKWNEGSDFAPEKGDIAINISNITEYVYENHTLKFEVPAEKTEEVFGTGSDLPYIVTVTITDDGAVITGITISYTIPQKSSKIPKTDVTVTTVYTYDLEPITID